MPVAVASGTGAAGCAGGVGGSGAAGSGGAGGCGGSGVSTGGDGGKGGAGGWGPGCGAGPGAGDGGSVGPEPVPPVGGCCVTGAGTARACRGTGVAGCWASAEVAGGAGAAARTAVSSTGLCATLGPDAGGAFACFGAGRAITTAT